MKPAARIIRWAIGYCALLAFFVTFANEEESTAALIGTGLLVSIYAALADVSLPVRLATSLIAALVFVVVLGLVAWPHRNGLLLHATLYGLVVGLLMPLRIYVGTIGQPRDSQAGKPTLLALFGLTMYFAVVASLLGLLNDPVDSVIVAAWSGAACAGSVLMLLGQSRKLQLIGIMLALGALAATVVLVFGSGPFALLLAMALLTPLCGAAVLRLNGYRLRR